MYQLLLQFLFDLAGITFATADKIMLALDSELEFREFELFKADYIA